MRVGMAVSTALLSLLGGCATSAMGAVTSGQEAMWAERPVDPLHLEPCLLPGSTEAVRCGTYHVPEDRSIVGGRTLPIKVVVIPARDPAPDMVPIIYFQGGPGAAASNGARFAIRSPEREKHDYILIDQRGTGQGHRLECPGPGNEADLGTWLESVYQAPYPARCRELLEKRADLRLYTTPIAMQDYDEIRRALGYDKVNLIGGSYGARAALVYLKMYGEHVHAALLAAHVPFEAKLPLYHPKGAQTALDRVFAECAVDPACNAAFPDPRADFETVRLRLRAKPATSEVRDPETGALVKVTFTEQRLLGAIRPMLYSLQMQRQLPLALRSAAQGDFSHFAPGALFARGANTQLAAGMALSVMCSEDVARITPEEIERETKGAFLGAAFVEERVDACSQWPDGLLPADHFEPFARQTPVLLMTGSHDPVTPQWMTDAYSRHFPNARRFVVAAGHALPEDRCISSITLELFAKADPKQVDVSCAEAFKPPPFALPIQSERG